MQKINRKTIIIILIIMTITLIYYIYSTKENEEIESFEQTNKIMENDTETEETKEKIKIHIAGAVNKEGLYELEEEQRIADAIEIAGGLKNDADLSDINLASKLEDGMKIYIPTINENTNENTNTQNINSTENPNTQGRTTDKININTASQSELDTLPGIGPSTALKIIKYREENGKFKSIEDIKEVSGIGESKYEQIKDLIKI